MMVQHSWRKFFALAALVGLWTLPVGAAFGAHDSSGDRVAWLLDDEGQGEEESAGEEEEGIHQEGELLLSADEETHDEEHADDEGSAGDEEEGIHQEGE